MSRSLPFVYAAEELGDALTDRLNPILARAQLTAAQFSVLYALVEEGPMKLSALAERQRCVKSNVSYITRAMQSEGLVELTASEDDQRTRVMEATKLGRQRYASAKAEAQKLEAVLRRKFGAAATDQLVQACLDAAAELDAL
jgi:DNA-binding MarR family transcriptional regulator